MKIWYPKKGMSVETINGMTYDFGSKEEIYIPNKSIGKIVSIESVIDVLGGALVKVKFNGESPPLIIDTINLKQRVK